MRRHPPSMLLFFEKKSQHPNHFALGSTCVSPGVGERPFPETFKRLHTVSSHLSSDIQIEGDLNCSTDLIFDGSIKGNITSKGSLTIGQNASVNGNLKAEKAVIEGKIVGNGDFNSCRLSPTSVISGSVNTVSLQMEEGASLEGQCKVGKAKA